MKPFKLIKEFYESPETPMSKTLSTKTIRDKLVIFGTDGHEYIVSKEKLDLPLSELQVTPLYITYIENASMCEDDGKIKPHR